MASQSFSALAVPDNLALLVGVGASSLFFAGHLAIARMGVMHILKSQHRVELGIGPEQALALWDESFASSYVYFVPTFLLALVALPVSAYTAEPGLARSLLATAAGLYGAIFVYSEFFTIPLNDKLKGHLTAARIRDSEIDTAKDAAALQMLDLWRTRLAIRTVLAGVGWAAALCAVVLR